MEAGGLQEKQEAFVAETGLDFSFIFVLYEGASGNPAVVEDVINYAETIGSPSFPVLADGNGSISDATPMTQFTHPEMCALTPELEIISCYSGHGGYDDALSDIRDHAGL